MGAGIVRLIKCTAQYFLMTHEHSLMKGAGDRTQCNANATHTAVVVVGRARARFVLLGGMNESRTL